MALEYSELKNLALAALRAEEHAPVAYTFSNNGETETYSLDEVNKALQTEFEGLIRSASDWRENKNMIFRLIEETIDEVLPKKVMQQYESFAETKVVPQGDKVTFRLRITEAARKRAKTFVTRVGLAGRYETFMLDGTELTVETGAIGSAAHIGFEEMLDGRWQFSDFTSIIMEGMDEFIYAEIAKALAALVNDLPAANKAIASSFDEATMDELLAIADAYGQSSIYCTYEFAATMIPAQNWASNEMKNTLWQKGYLGDYKGHRVIILPQSLTDETNTTKVIDPSQAYIIPNGSEKPVKIVIEGQTQAHEVEYTDDWSRDIQVYKKVGVATLANHWICSYRNTSLGMASRRAAEPVTPGGDQENPPSGD